MKARIVNINFIVKDKIIKCIITFWDPYWNNVTRIVKGVAKCNPNDTFDAIKGSRIAEGRAKKAMFDKLHYSAQQLSYKISEELGNRRYQSRREVEHLNKLIHE